MAARKDEQLCDSGGMVDTCVSGAYGAIRGGSSPPVGKLTKKFSSHSWDEEPPMRSIQRVQRGASRERSFFCL